MSEKENSENYKKKNTAQDNIHSETKGSSGNRSTGAIKKKPSKSKSKSESAKHRDSHSNKQPLIESSPKNIIHPSTSDKSESPKQQQQQKSSLDTSASSDSLKQRNLLISGKPVFLSPLLTPYASPHQTTSANENEFFKQFDKITSLNEPSPGTSSSGGMVGNQQSKSAGVGRREIEGAASIEYQTSTSRVSENIHQTIDTQKYVPQIYDPTRLMQQRNYTPISMPPSSQSGSQSVQPPRKSLDPNAVVFSTSLHEFSSYMSSSNVDLSRTWPNTSGPPTSNVRAGTILPRPPPGSSWQVTSSWSNTSLPSTKPQQLQPPISDPRTWHQASRTPIMPGPTISYSAAARLAALSRAQAIPYSSSGFPASSAPPISYSAPSAMYSSSSRFSATSTPSALYNSPPRYSASNVSSPLPISSMGFLPTSAPSVSYSSTSRFAAMSAPAAYGAASRLPMSNVLPPLQSTQSKSLPKLDTSTWPSLPPCPIAIGRSVTTNVIPPAPEPSASYGVPNDPYPRKRIETDHWQPLLSPEEEQSYQNYRIVTQQNRYLMNQAYQMRNIASQVAPMPPPVQYHPQNVAPPQYGIPLSNQNPNMAYYNSQNRANDASFQIGKWFPEHSDPNKNQQ